MFEAVSEDGVVYIVEINSETKSVRLSYWSSELSYAVCYWRDFLNGQVDWQKEESETVWNINRTPDTIRTQIDRVLQMPGFW